MASGMVSVWFGSAALRTEDATVAMLGVPQVQGRMFAVARRVLRDDEDARDAVQDACVCALRSIGGFEERARFSTWLHRVVVNAALMSARSRRRRHRTLEDIRPWLRGAGSARGPSFDPCESAEAVAQRREARALVRRSVDRLPERYRRVLVLRDLEDRDTAETARLLGMSPNAVKVRLHRARRALRQLLA